MSTTKKLTTAALRQSLFDATQKVMAGEIAAHDGRNIVGMANQINLSTQAEIKRMAQAIELGQKTDAFGDMVLGV